MPSLPNPAVEAVELEVISESELKAVGDKGFGGYGEPVTYRFRRNGSVKETRGASGARLVPIEDF